MKIEQIKTGDQYSAIPAIYLWRPRNMTFRKTINQANNEVLQTIAVIGEAKSASFNE